MSTAVVPIASSRRRLGRLKPFQLISLVIGLVLAALAIIPLYGATVGLFFGDGGFTIDPLREAFALEGFGQLVRNTVVAVVGSSLIALVLGSLMAWLNERTDARVGTITDSLPLIPFLLPPIAGAIGWVLLLSPQAGYINVVIRAVLSPFGINLESGPFDVYSWYGLMFVYVLYQLPYTYMMVSSGLRNADASLDEQSRVCGGGLWRTVWKVTLPSMKQSVGGAWLLMMLVGFSLYSVPLIIGTGARIDILSVEIVNLMTVSYPPEVGAAVGLSFVLVIFVGLTWLWQLRILRKDRYSSLAGKGQPFRRIELGRWRFLGRSVLLGYGIVSVILPALALLLVSLNGYWSSSIKWESLGIGSLVEAVFGDTMTLLSLKNSLWIGIVGATIGMVAAALLAIYVRQPGFRFGRATLDASVKLPSVFPHLVLAVGFILMFSGPPLNLGGTTIILLAAYVSMYFPQGSVAADAAVSQISKELPEASATFGATPARTFRKIYLPLMLPGLVAGWAFLFARMVGDLTATALLAGPQNTVVGFRILQIFTNGSFADLASLGLVLTLASSIVVISALVISHRLGRWRSGRATQHGAGVTA